ncbi:hypothetical protein DFH28DRAFT_1151945 [Melampsora americana]|nr:hypothetical protein DFH28DRAFT_1151945 [Melampsora americana]
MLPTTPASNKGSNKKNKSSLTKKTRDQDTILSDKKLARLQKRKLKHSPPDKTALMDSESLPAPYGSKNDEDMQEIEIQPLALPALQTSNTHVSQPALPYEEPAIPPTAFNLDTAYLAYGVQLWWNLCHVIRNEEETHIRKKRRNGGQGGSSSWFEHRKVSFLCCPLKRESLVFESMKASGKEERNAHEIE